jgi:hypothetical protein
MATPRLNMQIRRTRTRGLPEQTVQKVDHRRIQRKVLQRLVVLRPGKPRNRRIRFPASLLQTLNRRQDPVVRRNLDIKLTPRRQTQRIQRPNIRRIAHNHTKTATSRINRQNMTLPHEPQRNSLRQNTPNRYLNQNSKTQNRSKLPSQNLLVNQTLTKQNTNNRLTRQTANPLNPDRLQIRHQSTVS